jgi:hypothetical protein
MIVWKLLVNVVTSRNAAWPTVKSLSRSPSTVGSVMATLKTWPGGPGPDCFQVSWLPSQCCRGSRLVFNLKFKCKCGASAALGCQWFNQTRNLNIMAWRVRRVRVWLPVSRCRGQRLGTQFEIIMMTPDVTCI